MKTCDTCIHWKPVAEVRDTWKGLGNCSSSAWLRGYLTLQEDITPDSVLVEDDEGWGFATGPKFGCVHWQSGNQPEGAPND